MKEMCRNFIYNSNRCPKNTINTPLPASAPMASMLDVSMEDCSNCVMERIGLAQAYVPSQPYTMPMEQEQSLICGTIFSELAMPYCSGWNLYRFGREA